MMELKKRLEDVLKENSKNIGKNQIKEAEKKEKEKKPERGVETMFRLTISNHMDLSKMADDKANFLLSINGIILSLVIANLVSKLDVITNRFVVIPTAILMFVCLISIIFAILSTRPKLNTGNTTKEDITSKKANLLFFGNFHKMSLEDFTWGFNEMMKDRDFLYGSMIKDLYFLGKILGRKYYLVRISYTVFMWGIIVSVLGYVVSYWYYFSFLADQLPVFSSTP